MTLGVDKDLASISAALSKNQVFSMAKIWLLAGDYYLWFSGGRVLEILVKQHADMSLFVKHIVDKQQFQDLYFALKIEKNRFINILLFETKEIKFQLFC